MLAYAFTINRKTDVICFGFALIEGLGMGYH